MQAPDARQQKLPLSATPISAIERLKRRNVIAYAKATNEARGIFTDAATEAIYARYISGAIELDVAAKLLRE